MMNDPLKLGVFGLNWGPCGRVKPSRDLAGLAEALGYDSLWAPEHVVLPSPRTAGSPMDAAEDILDPLLHLAYLAAHTGRIRLATGILVLPQRNPLLLAKELASLDRLSGGRLIVGVGAGYLEPELHALGVPLAERGRRVEEYLGAMETLWTQPGPVSFHGTLTGFTGIDAHPRPLQQPTPPVVIGGHSRAALRRAVRRGAGWYGYRLTTAQVTTALTAISGFASQRPAQLAPLEITVTPTEPITPELLGRLSELGVDRVAVHVGRLTPADARHALGAAARARRHAQPAGDRRLLKGPPCSQPG